ncbi:MAG: hypothetical protein EBX64_03145, partial [Betaproteobacteria bacterium]|nr:hypothetical protein [Betaproteobacteria bacterium]
NALISAMLATPFEGRFAVYGSKGWFEIRDRKGLEERSCECYRGVVNDYRRLLDPGLFKSAKP